MMRPLAFLSLSLVLFAGLFAFSACGGIGDDDDDSGPSGGQSSTSTLTADESNWIDTGIEVAVGDVVTILAEGTYQIADGVEVDADGAADVCGDGCPNPDGHWGALTARIGTAKSTGCEFEAGREFQDVADCEGSLFLVINDSDYDDNSGDVDTDQSTEPGDDNSGDDDSSSDDDGDDDDDDDDDSSSDDDGDDDDDSADDDDDGDDDSADDDDDDDDVSDDDTSDDDDSADDDTEADDDMNG